MHHILNNLKPNAKELRLWADSCGSQNRSIKTVVLLMKVLQEHSTLEVIRLRFLLSGHSFNLCDSDFSNIEKKWRKEDRIYSLQEHLKIIQNSNSKKKIQIINMEPKNFQSCEPYLKEVTNRKQDADKNTLSWLQTHEVIINKADPLKAIFKYDLIDEGLTIDFKKRGKKAVASFCDIKPCQLYKTKRELTKEKLIDLKYLTQNFVPQDVAPYWQFLDTLKSGASADTIEGLLPVILEDDEELNQ